MRRWGKIQRTKISLSPISTVSTFLCSMTQFIFCPKGVKFSKMSPDAFVRSSSAMSRLLNILLTHHRSSCHRFEPNCYYNSLIGSFIQTSLYTELFVFENIWATMASRKIVSLVSRNYFHSFTT